MQGLSAKNLSAEEFLRKYQAAYSAKTGLKWSFEQKDLGIDEMLSDDSLLEQFKRLHGKESRDEVKKLFQPPIQEDDIARFVSRQLLKFVPHDVRERLSRVPVGSLPTNDANAAAIRTPSGEPVIVLNTGMTALISEAVNSFLGTIPIPGSEPEWTFSEGAKRIFQWTVAVAFGRPIFGLEKTPLFRDPRRMGASGNIGDNCRASIIGHEYGHFLLGHLDDSRITRRSVIPGTSLPPLEFYKRRQQEEYDADEKGFELAINFCKGTHGGKFQIVFFSIAFVFHLFDLFELLWTTEEEFRTHPPAVSRRAAFEELYRKDFDEEMNKEIAYIDWFFDQTKKRARNFIKHLDAE